MTNILTRSLEVLGSIFKVTTQENVILLDFTILIIIPLNRSRQSLEYHFHSI